MRTKIISLALLITACSGQQGPQGDQGVPGRMGNPGIQSPSSNIGITPASTDDCPTGGNIITVFKTIPGCQGGCPTIQTQIAVCNGMIPTPGPDSFVEAIEPCGVNSATYKEVLLRLQDGSVLASFSDNASGLMTRLILLPDGVYSDTDDSGCVFTLSTEGTTRSISWNGGGESWVSQL